MAALVPIFQVAGVVMGAMGTFAQGQAAAAQAKGQAAIANYNARVAKQDARAKELRTQFEQQAQAEAGARYGSSLLAGMGASGSIPSQGSPLLVQAQQAAESELDNLMIGYTGMVAAGQSRSQASLDRLQASVYRQQAGNYRMAGMIGAGTSLLTGFGSIAAQRAGYY